MPRLSVEIGTLFFSQSQPAAAYYFSAYSTMVAFEQEGQSLSLRQLELRCQLLDVDKRNAELRCEEYRKLLFAYLGESTTTTERQTGEFRFAAAAPAHVRQSDNVNVRTP